MSLGLTLHSVDTEHQYTNLQLDKILKENAILRSINKRKSEFLSMAIHDMVNPLGYISGILEDSINIIEQGSVDIGEIYQNLKHALTAFEKINSLVNDIQTINNTEIRKIDIQLTSLSINDLIYETIKIYDPIAHRKNISIVFEEKVLLPNIRIDKNKIRSVLENLLCNAIKYSYPGSRIQITVTLVNKHIIVSCRDWGQGLYPEEVMELFSGFKKFSARPTANETSTGLGLMIVKRFVEMHGGKVWAESKKGEGSTFSFSLPVKPRLKKK